MMNLSDDPDLAEQQMRAVIFYLTTFGYLDGDFDATEKAFVRDHIGKMVSDRARLAMKGADDALREEMVQKYTRHFHEVFEGIDQHIKDLFNEPVANDDDPNAFVYSKLKLRCFEIFKSFDKAGQELLMAAVDALMMADGEVHPAELQFRGELGALLEEELDVELLEDGVEGTSITVEKIHKMNSSGEIHPFFSPSEFHYSSNPDKIASQIAEDRALLDRAINLFGAQNAVGQGRLAGKHSVEEFAGSAPFLDGHVYVLPTVPGRNYEFIVLGDIHGCYSVLKAAVIQSRFFDKIEAFRKDPVKNPEPKLILLGDYIDRGLFSLNGVLRIVLQLLLAAPEHVYVLRGNHEYYIEHRGTVYGGVKPAESINTLKPHLPMEVFRHYSALFEALPNMLLCDRMLFVHGGIPRDRLIKERFKDLSSLNDPDIRFQMMWSDPSVADVVPADLQEKSARFAFGKLQCRSFLQRIGCHTIFRGHEKVDSGFQRVYDDPQVRLFTLFSAGGRDNDDLPTDSSYRTVTPMALTIAHSSDRTTITPWAPDYRSYNDPERNAFFKVAPEIVHKVD